MARRELCPVAPQAGSQECSGITLQDPMSFGAVKERRGIGDFDSLARLGRKRETTSDREVRC
jgi:hypothetical protein